MTAFYPRLSATSLRSLAMVLMLIDHIGHTLYPDQMWIRYIGRLAFPIFAFLISQGYRHTKNLPNYLFRLLLLALVSDWSFQFMSHQNWNYHPFQNVIWTFLISLVTIWAIDQLKPRLSQPYSYLAALLIFLLAYGLAFVLGTDYHGLGVATVLGFYYFPGKGKQLLTMVLVHIILANAHHLYVITPETFPLYWDHYGWKLFSPQYYAILSLPIIWLYSGKAGYQSTFLKTFNYLFYPLHMVVIGVVKLLYF